MALFQKSVLNKYLKTLNDKQVNAAYQKFCAFFHDPVIIQNIREDKEEQFQYGFLQALFDVVLDYTINPKPDFDLSTEFKNLRGAKKADGAILQDGKAVGVIELKSTKTKELSKITDQAFGYKNNHPTCVYVVTSNFEKLRFYINDAVDFLEFDLFTLKEAEFKLLYLCLQKDHVLSDLPLRIKRDSTLQEENITKKLYKDYSAFKNALFNDLVKRNPEYPKLALFKKSQKLIDRFLFIFFAEDKGLLPPNSISQIVKTFDRLEDLDNYKPLYEVFQQYFNYINVGRPARKEKAAIFAFNGGLFAPDEQLDNLKITDSILMNHTLLLSAYDFESEVDVNILGHIFEHSLNEIDEMTAELEGQPVDKNQTKRKKDGVFYTPKYITKYIVDNTVGKLCEAQKKILKFEENDYRPNRNKATKKRLLETLESYRSYLLELTICDPACGSGAFLNQALDFLMNEHQYLNELQTRLLGGSIVLSDITNDILERNIYGVDINEESVEIARLSLWLRTAQKGRTLTSLNKNIKCGNSLIDDPKVAGEKAFNWEKEFPKVFENGGFDVVVGNPPYVICQPSDTDDITLDFYKKFQVASYKIDLFHLFFENSINNLRENGILGFITPNTYLTNKYIKPLRNFLLKNTSIKKLIDHNETVFKEASVDVATIILEKVLQIGNEIEISEFNESLLNNLTEIKKQSDWLADENNIFNIKKEFIFTFKNCIPLVKICSSYFGIQAFDRKSSLDDIKQDDNHLPVIDGGDIFRYSYAKPKKFFNFISSNIKSGGDYSFYKSERIVVRQIGTTPIIGLAMGGIVTSNTLYNINLVDEKYDLKYILSLLNSKLIKKYWEAKYSDSKQLFPKIKGYQLKEIPIMVANDKAQNLFVKLSNRILDGNEKLHQVNGKFQRIIKRKFTIEKLSKNLQSWHTLTFTEFTKELKKKKVKLGLAEEAEWEDYFIAEKAKAQEIQAVIDQTDKEIDQMVYALYGLTEEEIAIVEHS